MTDALPALAVGLAAGLVMARGGLCFNRALRRAVFERRPALLRAFGIAVAVQLLLLPLLVAAGVDPLVRSAESGGPALLPAAQIAGGLLFGAGMALAGGCVTGMLWKAGGGAMALAIAIAGFVVGELLIRGPGDGAIAALDDAGRVRENGLGELLGIGYEPLALVLGAVGLVALLNTGLRGIVSGLALGAVAAVAWVAADLAGYGYGLGFVGLTEGSFPYQLWLAIGVIGGGALAGTKLRMPDAPRAARAAVGGLAMGAGGSLAHGCNIGHGLTGLPLLSLGSLLATACMAAGALVTWRLVLAPRT